MPKRGGLIFAPVTEKNAIHALEASIGNLYRSSENMRVSSALYLYNGGRWSVYPSPASLQGISVSSPRRPLGLF